MKVVELKQRPNFISTMEQDVEAEEGSGALPLAEYALM
jgi:hypothetical protein